MALMSPVGSLKPPLVLTRPGLGIRIQPPTPVIIDTVFLKQSEFASADDQAPNVLLAQIGETSAGADAATGLLLAGIGDTATDADAASSIGLAASEASAGLEAITSVGVGAAETGSGADGGLGLAVVVGESSSATDVVTRIFLAGIGETANVNEIAFAGAIFALRIESREFTQNIETREP